MKRKITEAWAVVNKDFYDEPPFICTVGKYSIESLAIFQNKKDAIWYRIFLCQIIGKGKEDIKAQKWMEKRISVKKCKIII